LGKSQTGSQWIAKQAAENPGTEWAIVAPTWRDVRKICIEGSSGLLKSFLPSGDGYSAEVDSMNLSDLQIRLTNGSKIYGYSADGYERLRGSNLAGAWVDEAAAMANVGDMFSDALMPALRIGEAPRVLITTTPRPIRFLRDLLERNDGSVAITRGSTWDNAANLSKSALAELRTRYEGTRAGRQELDGELLVDIEGALWSRDWVDNSRVLKFPTLTRIVVGVDPAVTSGEKSDSTGIVVVGKSHDGQIYVLEDLTMKGTPHACMAKAVSAYHKWRADKIVAERNNGGDYLEGVLRTVDANVSYGTVYATRGKVVRAEPISALWEQERGHVVGSLPELEDQMCSYTSDTDDSPDNFDAFIWAASELNVGGSAMGFLASISEMCHKCTLPSPKGSPACKHCGVSLTDAA
jgi:phage terminase large subunit-like protein